MTQTYDLWDFACEHETPTMTHYIPTEKKSDWSVVIFPGGGYQHRAVHEGKGYAEFLNAHGVHAFVVEYRVAPSYFPVPLADARRAVRMVRYFAKDWGVCADKIAVMGSSAGGHLAALVSNYTQPLENEVHDAIDEEAYRPNAQILCYPVISLLPDFGHIGSGKNLLGERYEELGGALSVQNLVTPQTPPAFVWHTFTDNGVPVTNSLEYVKALKEANVSAELHVFPMGGHGLGLADQDPETAHVAQWSGLLLNWLKTL